MGNLQEIWRWIKAKLGVGSGKFLALTVLESAKPECPTANALRGRVRYEYYQRTAALEERRRAVAAHDDLFRENIKLRKAVIWLEHELRNERARFEKEAA